MKLKHAAKPIIDLFALGVSVPNGPDPHESEPSLKDKAAIVGNKSTQQLRNRAPPCRIEKIGEETSVKVAELTTTIDRILRL